MGPLAVEVTLDTFHTCLEHVTFHQGEEMMGLLLGQSAGRVVRFHAPVVLKRKDKRPDRVEISPEDLSLGMKHADDLNQLVNVGSPDGGDVDEHQIRILGWYHSHPNITVWPSHVDLGTQDRFQMMDGDFVGLIFATYLGSADKTTHNNELVAFQAERESGGALTRKTIPCRIVSGLPKVMPFILQQRKAVPQILVQEEDEAYAEARASLSSLTPRDAISVDHTEDRLLGAASANLDSIVDHVMLPLLQQLRMEKDRTFPSAH